MNDSKDRPMEERLVDAFRAMGDVVGGGGGDRPARRNGDGDSVAEVSAYSSGRQPTGTCACPAQFGAVRHRDAVRYGDAVRGSARNNPDDR
jgi:hypothetical protein